MHINSHTDCIIMLSRKACALKFHTYNKYLAMLSSLGLNSKIDSKK